MSKFDTNGGYFAPKDYLRVNEGGSHEENPNGGVQIGVDPEGNPNLLEEGEPVYKDYVYSDNILAEREFLEQNHLPGKYDGKLYSAIADDLLTEAEERPLDPISRNGLEAMLGRLAEAQENQKQRDQQMELEQELANMSPEQLDELEAMLGGTDQDGGVEGMDGAEGLPVGSIQQPMAGMPMMACGGTMLRMFQNGGSTDDDIEKRLEEAREKRMSKAPVKTDNPLADYWWARMKLGARRLTNLLDYNGEKKTYKRGKDALDRLIEQYASGESPNPLHNQEGRIRGEAAVLAEQKMRIEERERKEQELLKERDEAQKRINAEKFPFAQSFVPVGGYLEDEGETPEAKAAVDTAGHFVLGNYTPPSDTSAWIGEEPDIAEQVDYDSLYNAARAAAVKATSGRSRSDIVIPAGYSEDSFARGGKMNYFDGGGWADFLKLVTGYSPSSNAGGIPGTYSIDRNFRYLNGNKDILALEESDPYTKFTEYVINHADDPNVRAYLELLDRNTGGTAQKLFENGQLRSGWDELYTKRRGDHVAGIYHLNPEDIGFLTAPAAPAAIAQDPQIEELGELSPRMAYAMSVGNQVVPVDYVEELSPRMAYAMGLTIPGSSSSLSPSTPVSSKKVDAKSVGNPAYSPLPTWPRYAGAVGSGLLGLYNAFQQPDRYDIPNMRSYLPEGRIHMQNQVYNPIDQNMIMNAQIAQGNATNRSLRNSGLGPSAASAILAADNNTTGNLGTGFLQTWDANNQRRNAVIAANNQAEAQRANFDWTVDSTRKNILNATQRQNYQNRLYQQMMNNQAEADKYTAISNQIGNGLQALSNIGKENFSMNQINSNRAFLGYGTSPSGWMTFNPGQYPYTNPYVSPQYIQWLENEAKKNGND